MTETMIYVHMIFSLLIVAKLFSSFLKFFTKRMGRYYISQ